LQVGRSTKSREEFLVRFQEIFTGVLIPVFFLGLAGGRLLAFRAFKPIRSLIQTVRSIVIGDMSARVPPVRTGDELEELVTLFNGMLERIESLINGMKGTLDNVAHDLRTPITRLHGVAEMALQSEGYTEALREALMDCAEEAEHIHTMLNTLMDISEAETGVMRLDNQEVDMTSLIEKAAALYQYVAEEEGIAIHLAAHEDLRLSGDPNRLLQVLANILDNAIKYTPEGGRVEIEGYKEDGWIVVRIKDTGQGIPPEELPRIWERLYRVDKSRSERGLGLGLSVVKAVMRAHQGRVEAVSEPGRGSIFTISLPTVHPDR
jgi:signal transduction histidine kinase